jgi:hypothetical protein
MTNQPTCEERIREHYDSRMMDLRELWAAYQSGEEDVPDVGSIYGYGLAFDYVEPDTFENQPFGYWRYQLSWGGPSDEFRLHGGGRIEYRFHDWWDGAGMDLEGDDLQLLTEIFLWFLDCHTDRHGF